MKRQLLLFVVSALSASGTLNAGSRVLLNRCTGCGRSLACRGGGGLEPLPARPAAPRKPGIPTGSSSDQRQQQDGALDTKYAADFLLRDRRLGFMRKVYATLSVQLAVTGAIVAFAQQNRPALLEFLTSEPKRLGFIVWSTFGVAIGSSVAMSCGKNLRRGAPGYGLTALFTLAESLLVAFVTLFYKTRSVTAACVQTAMAMVALTLYAFQTNPKYDMSGLGSMLFTSTACLSGIFLLKLFFNLPFSEVLLSTFGALIFSAWIVHDTYCIIGGRHRQSDQVDSKDHLMGANILYMDIINLFLHLLRLFGEREG